jgi:hypothetical protein
LQRQRAARTQAPERGAARADQACDRLAQPAEEDGQIFVSVEVGGNRAQGGERSLLRTL